MTDERPDDEPGDAAEADASIPAVDPEATAQTDSHSRGSILSPIALVAALAALACAGVLLWQYRQFYVSLADADLETRAGLERVRADANASEQRLGTITDTLADQAREFRALSERLDAVPAQFAELERRVDAIQGGSFDVRNQWLIAEAEYYLSVANAELQLGRRWDSALTALRLADDRLRQIGDPGLAGVREQLAADILALESVRLVDVEGLAHSLSRLGARVGQLPLRADAPASEPEAAARTEAEPGLGRLWSSVRDAFTSIVRVERRDEPLLAALSAEEIRLIRRQLGIELQSARLALVSGEVEVFAASLEQAAALLREDFDLEAADVEGGLRLVESLLELDIAPSPPDISRSLYALRARGEP